MIVVSLQRRSDDGSRVGLPIETWVRSEFIQPGKSVQNAYVETFKGRLGDSL